MIVDIIMPKMGESITEGTILEWKKSVGERVEKDEILLEIGTDKVDSEIPSSYSGIIAEILAQPNDVVEVGKVIARINTGGVVDTHATPKELIKDAALPQKPEPVKTEAPKKQVDQPITLISKAEKKYFTPVVKSIARNKGISQGELETIQGTGINGRVTKQDLLAYIESKSKVQPAPIAEKKEPVLFTTQTTAPMSSLLADVRVEMDKMRRSIAEHMRASLDTAAHVHLINEVDMSSIVRFVHENEKAFAAREGFSLTYTPFIVLASIRALQNYPDMNSSIEGSTIIRKKNINMGIAVAVEGGLVVPVIPRCEELNFLGLCRKIRDLAVRARNKQLKPEELYGSTFSISNFGTFNVTTGTPIINLPNVGILGVGTIKKKPVVVETAEGDVIAVRSMMYLSIGFDHRLIDGAGGAKFVQNVQQNLENMKFDQLF